MVLFVLLSGTRPHEQLEGPAAAVSHCTLTRPLPNPRPRCRNQPEREEKRTAKMLKHSDLYVLCNMKVLDTIF